MPNCPRCNGAGQTMCFVDGYDKATGKRWGDFRQVPCRTCQGTGQMTNEQIADHEARQALRAERRRARLDRGESQRDAAKRLGMGWIESCTGSRAMLHSDESRHNDPVTALTPIGLALFLLFAVIGAGTVLWWVLRALGVP